MSKLVTAREIADRDRALNVSAWIRAESLKAVQRSLFTRPWDGRSVSGAPVAAFVDFGCWVARCDICGGHCYVDPDEPVFFCLRCGNDNSGAARPVVFPGEIDLIEDALLARPVTEDLRARNRIEQAKLARPENLPRNWHPLQSLESILAENSAQNGGQS